MPLRRIDTRWWLLMLTAALVIAAGLGLRDPWPSDEPRFALVARQMVESGNWWFPHRGSELYSDKPPMLMWWQAALYSLLGNWRVAFLLPSLIAAMVTLACVVDLGSRLWNRRVGLYAGWALLLAVQFVFQAKKAQIDPLVVMFITLANYGLLRHLLLGPAWRWWALGWLAAGLGVITKGVGVLALLMLLPAALASRAGWRGVAVQAGDRRFWLGPACFLLAIALWLVPVLVQALATGLPEYHAYLHDILLRQTAGRYTRSWDHHQPPWYFLGTMATLWLPTVLLLPWALPAWWRRLRRRDARYLLPLAWWLLLLVFFSLPDGKRDVYLLPALPMLCLALAPLLPGLLRRRDVQAVLAATAVLLSLSLLWAGAAVLLGEPGFEQRLMAERGIGAATTAALGWCVLAMGAGGVAALAWLGWRRGHQVWALLLSVVWVIYGLCGYPLLNDSSSARGTMQRAGQLIGPRAELGLVGWKEQNLLMADRPARDFGFKRDWLRQLDDGIAWQQQAPARRWLFVQEPLLLSCIDRAQAQWAGTANRRRWWLVPGAAVATNCRATAAEVQRVRQAQGRAEEVDED